jgi:hypothetical protein
MIFEMEIRKISQKWNLVSSLGFQVRGVAVQET